MPRAEVVKTFEISLATLKRWLKNQRETGELTPLPATGGPERRIAPDHYDQLRLQVATHPDATLAEHAALRLREMLAARGCQLWYLPSYSPDFSPIELAFAKVKAELRRTAARSREALERAIGHALKQISPAEARALEHFSPIVASVFVQIWLNGSAFSYSGSDGRHLVADWWGIS
jgi:hypothetical protein